MSLRFVNLGVSSSCFFIYLWNLLHFIYILEIRDGSVGKATPKSDRALIPDPMKVVAFTQEIYNRVVYAPYNIFSYPRGS